MGLEHQNESIEALDKFEDLKKKGIPVAADAPFGRRIYSLGNTENTIDHSRIDCIYSLEFLEIHDVFAKYIDEAPSDFQLNDKIVAETLEYIATFNRSEVAQFIETIGFSSDLTEDIYDRLQAIEDLNGESLDVLRKINILSTDLQDVLTGHLNRLVQENIDDTFELIKHLGSLTQKDYVKAAFAIHKISERSSYSTEFNYIENVFKYIGKFFNIDLDLLENEVRIKLIEVISSNAKNPVFDLLNKYAHPFFKYYQIDTIKSINDPNKWFSLYKEALRFIIKVFAKQGESVDDSYKYIKKIYAGCGGLIPDNFNIFMYSDYEEYEDSNIDFVNFGEYIKKLIIDNSGCETEEQWRIFSMATFMLEVIGKINQLNTFRNAGLQEANANLINKFENIDSEFCEYQRDIERSNDNFTVLISKITIDGEEIPVTYKFAKIKSKESMLRKTLVKGTPISSIKDTFRMMIVLPKGSLADKEKREKICSALISTHMTFLGDEVIEESVKNTFANGMANNYSQGSLRCFKYASKFEVEDHASTVEIMILEEYPDDHVDYEANMYKRLRAVFALCTYQRAMEELAEEISRKAILGFEKEDLHLIRPLFTYVQNKSIVELKNLDQNFIESLKYACTRAQSCEVISPYNIMAATSLRILSSVVS